jgi:hypothetical protein
MKRSLVVIGVAALAAFALASLRHPGAHAAPEAGFLRLPPATPAGEQVFYGHIVSLKKTGARYELRFDPAWLLMGTTAQKAAVADGVLQPGEPVPNDNYTRDESHKLLVFKVPLTARATILTNEDTQGLSATRVPIPELAQIVAGQNPKHRKLFGDPKGFGFWARVAMDSVRSLDEQYHP